MWRLVQGHCHVYVHDSYFGERKGTGRWGTNLCCDIFWNVHPLTTNRTTQLLQRDMHGRQVEAFHWADTDTVLTPWRMLSSKQSQLIICVMQKRKPCFFSSSFGKDCKYILSPFKSDYSSTQNPKTPPTKTHLSSSIVHQNFPSHGLTWIDSS